MNHYMLALIGGLGLIELLILLIMGGIVAAIIVYAVKMYRRVDKISKQQANDNRG